MITILFKTLLRIFRSHSTPLAGAGAKAVIFMDGTCNDLRDLAAETMVPVLRKI